MKEVDKEKGVTALLSLAILSELMLYFRSPCMSAFCLISTVIYMFVNRKESNLIQIWNIMLRRHLISFSGGQLCRLCEKALIRHT